MSLRAVRAKQSPFRELGIASSAKAASSQ